MGVRLGGSDSLGPRKSCYICCGAENVVEDVEEKSLDCGLERRSNYDVKPTPRNYVDARMRISVPIETLFALYDVNKRYFPLSVGIGYFCKLRRSDLHDIRFFLFVDSVSLLDKAIR